MTENTANKLLVYVAGPMGNGPDCHENVIKAIHTADLIEQMGAVPFLPHLHYYWHIVHPKSVEKWLDIDIEHLKRCHALFRRPGDSPGADRETRFARQWGLQVFRDEKSLKDYIRLQGT